MVFVSGVTINGSIPYELRGFPVLTAGLRDTLQQRYQFLHDRSVLVYAPDVGSLSSADISDTMRRCADEVDSVNGFRSRFLSLRSDLLGADAAERPALEAEVVRGDSLILDHWASGIRVFDAPGRRPSLLGNLRAAVTLSDVLTGKVAEKFRFPKDGAFQLHLAVDASYSMKASGRDDIVRDALLLFDQGIRGLFPRARLFWHAFSESCAPMDPPFRHFPVTRGETHYASFVRKVLHSRIPELPATVLLFTDGVPSDHAESLEHLKRFERLGIDYTQIVFRIAEEGYGVTPEATQVLDGFRLDESASMDPLAPEEQAQEVEKTRLRFSELAIAAGGNQIILTLDRALGVIAVEAFDRWLGAFSSN